MSIKPTPARPPCFDPNDPRFWDIDDLEYEMRRVFEICHGCRMCVTYCPSFPALFDRIDERHEKLGQPHDATSLDAGDLRKVADLCWQCKICYVKCPYTPDDKHDWQVDYPRLIWREKVVRTRREGNTLQEKILGEPGVLGRLNSGPLAPLVNFVSAQSLVRKAGEKLAGISARFPVPTYTPDPFDRWFARHRPAVGAGTLGEVALFSTCLVDYNRPSTGRFAVCVLEHCGLRVVRPSQVCCGMPNMDTGDLDRFRDKATHNVSALAAEVRAGREIVVPGPSCSMTIRREYPEILGTEDARLVADHTFDLMEYLWRLWREDKLPRTFAQPLGKVAYHAPCHLRAQRVSLPARMLLERVPDTEIEVVEQCSAVDGTWGMKAQFYDLGVQYSRKLVRKVAEAEAGYVASDCPLASQRIMKENGVAVVHPIELLARAYGLTDEGAG
jgi:glycerol-3-phosphate dehydrogenase subunit C